MQSTPHTNTWPKARINLPVMKGQDLLCSRYITYWKRNSPEQNRMIVGLGEITSHTVKATSTHAHTPAITPQNFLHGLANNYLKHHRYVQIKGHPKPQSIENSAQRIRRTKAPMTLSQARASAYRTRGVLQSAASKKAEASGQQKHRFQGWRYGGFQT